MKIKLWRNCCSVGYFHATRQGRDRTGETDGTTIHTFTLPFRWFLNVTVRASRHGP